MEKSGLIFRQREIKADKMLREKAQAIKLVLFLEKFKNLFHFLGMYFRVYFVIIYEDLNS